MAAAFFSLFVLGSLGLPGLNGFVGEFLILLGVFQYAKIAAAFASVGIILGAAYLLWMYQRTMFQELTNKKWLDLKDLNLRELVTLVPLAAAALFIGLYPAPLLRHAARADPDHPGSGRPYLARQSVAPPAGRAPSWEGSRCTSSDLITILPEIDPGLGRVPASWSVEPLLKKDKTAVSPSP